MNLTYDPVLAAYIFSNLKDTYHMAKAERLTLRIEGGELEAYSALWMLAIRAAIQIDRWVDFENYEGGVFAYEELATNSDIGYVLLRRNYVVTAPRTIEHIVKDWLFERGIPLRTDPALGTITHGV